VYLASPRSFTIQTLEGDIVPRHTLLKKSIEITHKCFPNTDIYVFHEDYTDDDKASLVGITEFLQVDFSGKNDVYNPSSGNKKGYLMMCRFFSGILQAHPVIQKYSHYMRLDDDSFFRDPYPTKIDFLNNDYIFRSVFHETKSQQTLYDFTMKFLMENGLTLSQKKSVEESLSKFNFLYSGKYTGFAPYNNFHISSLRLWKHPIVSRYIRAIEETNGIFREGWLDANIHAMIVFVFPLVTGSISVAPNVEFGYQHNNHLSLPNSVKVVYTRDIPFYPK
jgi:hypothetical protein